MSRCAYHKHTAVSNIWYRLRKPHVKAKRCLQKNTGKSKKPKIVTTVAETMATISTLRINLFSVI